MIPFTNTNTAAIPCCKGKGLYLPMGSVKVTHVYTAGTLPIFQYFPPSTTRPLS